MAENYKITLSLGTIGVEADPSETDAKVNDVITFFSGDGSQMIIRFFEGKSPFRTGNKTEGGVVATVQASKPHTCVVEGSYSFFCEIRDESGNLVAYDIDNGGGVNVGH